MTAPARPEAIARNLREMSRLRTPTIAVITGEGGSGGALALAVADRVLMLEKAIYSVISPEACASIMWRDAAKRAEAAEALRATAPDAAQLGCIDGIVPEPEGGAHTAPPEAARLLGRRAVLLTGKHAHTPPDTPELCHAGYAPYSLLFPHAAAVVHQGGVGTTAQALRAAKPMLVMPYSHDQPDNARRMQRLGVARVLPRERYMAARAARVLGGLLGDPAYAARAWAAAERLKGEDGLRCACDALENAARKR